MSPPLLSSALRLRRRLPSRVQCPAVSPPALLPCPVPCGLAAGSPPVSRALRFRRRLSSRVQCPAVSPLALLPCSVPCGFAVGSPPVFSALRFRRRVFILTVPLGYTPSYPSTTPHRTPRLWQKCSKNTSECSMKRRILLIFCTKMLGSKKKSLPLQRISPMTRFRWDKSERVSHRSSRVR